MDDDIKSLVSEATEQVSRSLIKNFSFNYRGFLPNATFGSGKKFALAKLGKNSQKIALMK
jgi:hypothetical protein